MKKKNWLQKHAIVSLQRKKPASCFTVGPRLRLPVEQWWWELNTLTPACRNSSNQYPTFLVWGAFKLLLTDCKSNPYKWGNVLWGQGTSFFLPCYCFAMLPKLLSILRLELRSHPAHNGLWVWIHLVVQWCLHSKACFFRGNHDGRLYRPPSELREYFYLGNSLPHALPALDSCTAFASLDFTTALHSQKNMPQECQRPALLKLFIHSVHVPFHLPPLWDSSRAFHLQIIFPPQTNVPSLLWYLLQGERILLTGHNRPDEHPAHFQISFP